MTSEWTHGKRSIMMSKREAMVKRTESEGNMRLNKK